MKTMTSFLICFIAIAFVPVPLSADGPTIAILDFENHSFFNPEEYQPMSKGLAEIMITEFSGIGSIRVVERRKLQALLDELKLSQTGLTAEDNSIRVGKLLGAQHLVFGGYMVTMDEKIRIDVRIVEVETGLTLKAGEVTGKTKQVLPLVKKLSQKILRDLQVKLTREESESFEKSKEYDLKAVLWFSKGVEFEDRGKIHEAKQCYGRVLQIEPDFEKAKSRLSALEQKGE